MEKRNVTVTLEKAKEWYNSDNESLKEIALQAFSRDEIMIDFENITSFKEACIALGLNCIDISIIIVNIEEVAAMMECFKVLMLKKVTKELLNKAERKESTTQDVVAALMLKALMEKD